MFDTVCSIPLAYELFDQAIHPTEPIVSVGLASGHVLTYRLPPAGSNGDVKAIASESGFGQIETLWKTRRHKGSCRTLTFGADGHHLYSAGTDGIVKAADVATGQVTAKIAIPRDALTNALDHPTVLHTLSPQSLILATDSSAVHIYDLRELAPTASPRPHQTYHPHDDYISSITPLPPSEASTSGFPKQWVSTGGTTLAITDIRRGVMAKSEDQGEELLSSTIVTGLPKRGTNVGEKVIIGGNTGVLTLWERGVWDDQDERIKIDPDESIDSLAVLPEGVGPGGKIVAVGLGNGALSFAKIGPNLVVAELKHDDFQSEAVVGLGFDVAGRLISGGGKIVKVWHEKLGIDGDDDDQDSEEDSDSDMDSSSDEDEDSDEDDNKKKRKRKGKKRIQVGILNHTFDDLEGPPSEAAETPVGASKKGKGKAQKRGKRK